jgi:hypothetical protein
LLKSVHSNTDNKWGASVKGAYVKLAALTLGSVIAWAAPTLASADDFAGSWAVSGVIHGDGPVVLSIAADCVFQQTGTIIAGTCKGPYGLGPASGTVVGPKIAFEAVVKATAPGGLSGALAFAGAVGPDNVIRGEVKYAGLPGHVGAFTAQRP